MQGCFPNNMIWTGLYWIELDWTGEIWNSRMETGRTRTSTGRKQNQLVVIYVTFSFC